MSGFLSGPQSFDDPLPGVDFDPVTGEALTPDPSSFLQPPSREPSDVQLPAPVPTTLALIGSHVLDVGTFGLELRTALSQRVDELYGAALAKRPKRMSGEHELPPTTAEVAGELQLLAEMHDTLDVVGKSFADAAKSARQIASDVLLETLPDERVHSIETHGGSASVRVGDRRGGAIKVTTTQSSTVSVDDDELIDVLVSELITAQGKLTKARAEAFAEGARAGIAQLLAVTSPPKWKSTALDAIGRTIETRDDHELAARFARAYGRKVTGSPSTKIEHVDDELES